MSVCACVCVCVHVCVHECELIRFLYVSLLLFHSQVALFSAKGKNPIYSV